MKLTVTTLSVATLTGFVIGLAVARFAPLIEEDREHGSDAREGA